MTKDKMVTRSLAYLQVSTEEQAASGNGLHAQRSTVIAEAERRGWPVEVVADEGASGKNVNKHLRDCLDQLEAGRADALIVAKMDRLARSVLHAWFGFDETSSPESGTAGNVPPAV